MFDPEFYPTPKSLISKMMQGVPFDRNTVVLEPSAGSGAMLDYLFPNGLKNTKSKPYCFERNPELAEILKGKGYAYLGDDFLEYHGHKRFDLIIMNPPFSNGDEHVLKAIDVLKEGHLVALLNAETIRNPYSQKRKLLVRQIDDLGGTIEYVEDAFTSAARKTDVEVAIVRLSKKKQATEPVLDFEFEAAKQQGIYDLVQHSGEGQGIQRADLLASLERSANKAKEAVVALAQAWEEIALYTKPFDTRAESTLCEILKNSAYNSYSQTVNSMVQEINQRAWYHIMSEGKIRDILTGKARENFHDYCDQQGQVEFTAKNVNCLLNTLMESKDILMRQAVEEVFNFMCSYDAKNKVHWEGWKTNSAHKVNKKVILPIMGGYNYGGRVSFQRVEMINDVDRAMAFLSGETFKHGQKDSLVESINASPTPGDKYESRYFYFRRYQKGTVHIEWKDAKLWERFNITAAKMKKWLPS